jgi:trans-2,3-dihydro-3-hydroxyanthranilate isomerase
MSSYDYVTLDVFTTQRFGGNQLAVILDARGLSDAQMQAIAKEFNFSETTFVLPPQHPAHTAQVRIFTPGNEMPFAGHPTVGTAHALAALGKATADLVIFEELVGPVPVQITRAGHQVTRCTLTAPRNPQAVALDATPHGLAAVYSLQTNDFNAHLPFCAMSSGNALLITPLATRAAHCTLELAQLKQQSATTRNQQLYPCVIDAASRTAFVRMFAPNHGVLEDAATGSAAATFAGYLAQFVEQTDGTYDWTIHQGIEMGRPSEITLRFTRTHGAAKNVQVGGASVMVMRGTLEV